MEGGNEYETDNFYYDRYVRDDDARRVDYGNFDIDRLFHSTSGRYNPQRMDIRP
jgi:hypothetical protein